MKRIQKEITIQAPVNEVYSMWTSKEKANTFFGADSKIEFQKQGAYEIYFNLELEYGLRGSEGCVVLGFEENNYLSFSWNVPPIFEEERKKSERLELERLESEKKRLAEEKKQADKREKILKKLEETENQLKSLKSSF